LTAPYPALVVAIGSTLAMCHDLRTPP